MALVVYLGAGRDCGHGTVQLPRGGGDCKGEGIAPGIAPTTQRACRLIQWGLMRGGL